MAQAPMVQFPQTEVPRLREAMRDVQLSVASFYAETACSNEELGRWVRAFLSTSQVVNDLLTNRSARKVAYKSLFNVRIAGVDLIEAIKYARNVDQHIFHIVEPGEAGALIGGLHGYRSYVVWDEVPLTAHSDLHRGTQALKPRYDAELKGKDVTEAMIGVLRFYGSLDPAIIHRDHRGEWTGFPLADQPGVASPLHPEEPLDDAAAAAWLDARRPNGDARVVCAQVTFEDVRYFCGLTFADQRSFSPFAETAEQIECDIAAGMPYLIGDVAANIENVWHAYPRAHGGVYFSPVDVTSWATPIVSVERQNDWQTCDKAETWRRIVRAEHGASARLLGGHLIRRARRLNAYVPSGD